MIPFSSKADPPSLGTKKIRVIQHGHDSFLHTLRSLWENRELLFILTSREVSLRYRQTALGVTWVILQPLLASAVFTVVFGLFLNAPSDDVSYPLFTFAGLLPWGVFSQSLQKAGISLLREIRLITKIFFPRVIIPVATIFATLVDFSVSLILLLILMPLFGAEYSINLLVIPLLLLITLLFSIGLGVLFASITVFYRDFMYVTPFVIQVWLYASPLVYSASIVPPAFRWVYYVNPMVGVISGFRWAVFAGLQFPAISLAYSTVVSLIVFVAGILVFNRFERKFADVI